jgi:conjugal transfer pilus assembly protein TraK
MNKILWVFLLCFSTNIFAMQKYTVADGDSIKIKVSSNDLTRIKMASGRIDAVWGLNENFTYKADRGKGELFIRPIKNSKLVSSFFVKDGFGSVYSVIAEQHGIPAETVVLKSLSKVEARSGSSSSSRNRSSSQINQIKKLVKSMALNESITSYSRQVKNEEIKLWRDIKIFLTATYVGRKLEGEIYLIQNMSKDIHTFHESEFKQFGENARFSGLDNLRLSPAESTKLYIVRDAK